MRIYLDCFPCFLRQALHAARLAGADGATQRAVLDRVAALLPGLPRRSTPVEMGRRIHGVVNELAGTADPYLGVKREWNERALALYPRLRAFVESAAAPLRAALTVAAIGNTIDFGADPGFDLDAALARGLEEGLDARECRAFEERLAGVTTLLYVGDNAGEIVFDRVLVEHLVALGRRVTFVVRGGPILNDATREDALRTGMDRVASVMESGTDAPGTLLGDCSPQFVRTFREAELVLAKGQGNYEGLSGEPGPLFFLLKAKCAVVAEDLGVPPGTLVLRGTGSGAGGGPR